MTGGWVGSCASVVVVFFLVAVLAGCGGSKSDAALEGLPDRGETSLGETSLGGTPRGSLDDAQGGRDAGGGPLEDIIFYYDSFELDEPSRATLRRNTTWLEEHPAARVEIEGHCDDRGTIEYNLALGAKRAAAAKSYLVALGIDASRITTISYGEELPLCREATTLCWQRNRRGHFVVFGE
jgi:peptidoglycan-associated lipoprotein